jgi:hypothetical protein
MPKQSPKKTPKRKPPKSVQVTKTKKTVMMMPAYKFIGTDLKVLEIPTNAAVEAGTMFVVPYVEGAGDVKLPDFSVLCAGQRLSREYYPELSPLYSDTGGFYEFILPKLEGIFLLGFDEDGFPIKGSGAVFYRSIPLIPEQVRDIR